MFSVRCFAFVPSPRFPDGNHRGTVPALPGPLQGEKLPIFQNGRHADGKCFEISNFQRADISDKL
jgi:hypothetical protein